MESRDTQIETLKKELESYRNTSDQAENALQTAQSTQQSYEALMKVAEQYEGGATSNADMLDGLFTVSPDALGEQGKAIYDEISGELFPTMCSRLLARAKENLNESNYADAVTNLEKVVRMEAGYSDGEAMKLLGDAYAGSGDADKAKEAYGKVVSDYSGTQAATDAQSALDAMNTASSQNDGQNTADGSQTGNTGTE